MEFEGLCSTSAFLSIVPIGDVFTNNKQKMSKMEDYVL